MRFRLFGRVYTFSKKTYVWMSVIILALVAAIGFGMMEKSDSRELPLIQTHTPEYTPSPTLKPVDNSPSPTALIAVYISGEVACPGVYWVNSGSILQDVVTMAGGALPQADLRNVNLALRVEDGMHVHLSKEGVGNGDWLLATGNGAVATPKTGKVNINTATLEELMTLSGIGESTAGDILQYRQEHGPFATIEDLMNVPGIKQAKFDKFKNQVTV